MFFEEKHKQNWRLARRMGRPEGKAHSSRPAERTQVREQAAQKTSRRASVATQHAGMPHASAPAILLGSEETVTSIAKTGKDVALLIELLVDRGCVNLDLRKCLTQCLNALGRGEEADEFH